MGKNTHIFLTPVELQSLLQKLDGIVFHNIYMVMKPK